MLILRIQELEEWSVDLNEEGFTFSHLIELLKDFSDKHIDSILTKFNQITVVSLSHGSTELYSEYPLCISAELLVNNKPAIYSFCYQKHSKGEGIEVIIYTDHDLHSLIRIISNNISEETKTITNFLYGNFN